MLSHHACDALVIDTGRPCVSLISVVIGVGRTGRDAGAERRGPA